MALLNRINDDLKAALKSQNQTKAMTLRLLLSAVHNKEIEKKAKSGMAELSDEDIRDLIRKEAKKRKEAMAIYQQGGREELAEKEMAELKILAEYLPPQASEAEIEAVVKATISELQLTSEKDFGKAMKEAMARLKGKADAELVSRAVKKFL